MQEFTPVTRLPSIHHKNLSDKQIETLVDYTTRLAKGLKIVGLLNIQYVISNDEVYVIEVNPRSSRTVPFLSKITSIPMANIATKAILGQSIIEQGYTTRTCSRIDQVFM